MLKTALWKYKASTRNTEKQQVQGNSSMPILATWEAEIRGLLEPRNLRLAGHNPFLKLRESPSSFPKACPLALKWRKSIFLNLSGN
jgi:hypothetical protein